MNLPGAAEADARMARSGGVIEYLPEILAYPLRGFALPVLLMITLFVTVGMRSNMILPDGLPDTGIPLLAITAMWTIYYLQRVIQHSARGHALPPALAGDVVYLTGGLKPLALPVLMAWGYFPLQAQRPELAQAFLALSFVLLPAYLFILATEEDLLAALNPLRWLEVILLMGWPYLAAVTLLAIGVLAVNAIAGLVGLSLLVAFTSYVAVACAHMLGYAGFRRHSSLGLHVEVRHPDAVAREREQARRLASLQTRIQGCLQRGDEDGAARAVTAEPGGPVNVRIFFEDLFQHLLVHGTFGLVHVCGRRLITVLLAENRGSRALEVAEQCLNKNSHFEPENPLQLETLAREALSARYYGLFERLLRNLDQRYPDNPVIVTTQLLRAQYLAEHRGDEAGALAALQPALAATSHPQHARIAAYARALTHLTRNSRA